MLLAFTFTSILAYIIYKLYIKTYLHLRYLKKKGFDIEFNIGLNGLGKFDKNLKEKGDMYYEFKQMGKRIPEARGFTWNIFNVYIIMLTDTNLIREFTNKQDKYVKSEFAFIHLLRDLGDGLVFSEGNQWKRHRKITSTAFHFEFLTD